MCPSPLEIRKSGLGMQGLPSFFNSESLDLALTLMTGPLPFLTSKGGFFLDGLFVPPENSPISPGLDGPSPPRFFPLGSFRRNSFPAFLSPPQPPDEVCPFFF